MFSCKFCDVVNNTFFAEHLWTTASVVNNYAKGYSQVLY